MFSTKIVIAFFCFVKKRKHFLRALDASARHSPIRQEIAQHEDAFLGGTAQHEDVRDSKVALSIG